MSLQDRTATIFRAYEIVEGVGARNRIALASGLTVSEAHAAGMLPVQIITAARASDPITPERAKSAMIEFGGSTVFGGDTVQLRFTTVLEAQQVKKALIERFPGTDDVWIINREVFGFDAIGGEDESAQILTDVSGPNLSN